MANRSYLYSIDFDLMINEYYQDIMKIDREIAELEKNDIQSKEKISNLEAEKWSLLGINYWSDVLYYHFSNAE